MAQIEVIGKLIDEVTMVNHDTREVIIAGDVHTPIKFSIDHPYIQGTRLEREARAVLDRGADIKNMDGK